MREAARRAFEPNRRNLAHWVSWGVALLLQCSAAFALRHGRIFDWEVGLARLFQKTPGRYEIFDVGHLLTNTLAWEFLPILGAVFIITWGLGERLGAWLLLLSFPLHVLAQWPKAVVDRERPPAGFADLDGVGGLQSFPSGHAEFVVTFWGFQLYLLLVNSDRRRVKLAMAVFVLVLALATGFGRIAIGRHWPLDILVSYVVGLGLLSGLIWLHSAFRGTGEGEVAHTGRR